MRRGVVRVRWWSVVLLATAGVALPVAAGAGTQAGPPTQVTGVWPFVDVSSGSGTPGVPDTMKGLVVTVRSIAGTAAYDGVISTASSWDCHGLGFKLFRLESGPVDQWGFAPATLYRSSKDPNTGSCVDPGPLTATWRIIEVSRRNPSDPNGPSIKAWELQLAFFGGDQAWNFDRPKATTGTTTAKTTTSGAKDTTAPRVTALASSGKAGAKTKLLYRVSDDSGETKDSVTIYVDSKPYGSATGSWGPAKEGRTYSWSWTPPASWRGRAGLSFCVTAVDRAGNRSNRSCAPIRLR